MPIITFRSQQGMTLLELAVVLLVLIGLAGLVIPYVGGNANYARCTTTDASMTAIRNAILGSFEKPGYFEDMGRLPAPEDAPTTYDLQWLNDQGVGAARQPDFNPVTKRGWRGPYLISTVLNDGYLQGVDIGIQVPTVDADANDCVDINAANTINDCARLGSAGPNGTFETLAADADGQNRNDDRLLYLFIPDPNSSTSCQELLL